jgi:hypothetical protein
MNFGVSLRTLEERLGSEVMHLRPSDPEADPIVRALDIYDAAQADVGGEGVLLCVVSAGAMRDDEITSAITSAAAHGCAGIAIKMGVDEMTLSDSVLLQCAVESAISVVMVQRDTSWREFDALVTQALGESAASLTLAPMVGDKLFAVANTIARVFGGSVAIEDHQRTILAHSSVSGQAIDELRTTGILFRRAGDAPVNEARYQEVLEASGPVRFSRYGDALPRTAIALRAGTIPLGSIWVLDPDGDDPEDVPLSPDKERALELGATVAASALLESWKATSRAGSRRETALRRVLIAAAQQGDREELDPTGDGIGVVLSATVATGPRSAGRIAEARAVFARHLATYIPNVVVSAEANEIIALCPTSQVDQVRDWALSAVADLSADTSDGIQVGISEPHSISSQLPFAAQEARDIARLSLEIDEPVGTVPRVRTQLFVASCRAQLELDDRLLLPEVRELLDGGESTHHLVVTLENWLAEAGNVARTAHRLSVHEQTVRYRLRRLRERLPLEDAHPDYLLTLWAQLRALR